MTATKNDFFKPTKLSAEAKAKQTTNTVRAILDEEAAARGKKTEALRALRLAQPEPQQLNSGRRK